MNTIIVAVVAFIAIGAEVVYGYAGRTPTASELQEALSFGMQAVREYDLLDAKIEKRRESMYSRSKVFSHDALNQSREAAVELNARQYLSAKLGIPAASISFDGATVRQSPLPPITPCSSTYPFRTADGSCNNLNSPRYGQASTIFGRLFPANYADGVGVPRKALSGNPLPSPRQISTTVTINDSVQDCDASFLVMQWGQFLDHDLTLTPQFKTATGDFITCCSGTNGFTGSMPAAPLYPECFPIAIPSTDPIFSAQCMEFVRSTYGLRLDGSTPPNREQVNLLTHWIDGSNVYGSSAAATQALRDTTSGKGLLKTSIINGLPYLPLANTCCPGDPTNSCAAAASCFFAGDVRVAEQPLLTVMHTIWMREHNRVANELYKLYGSAKTDEFYFQQARRIVISEMQHIIYTEYLPVLLGQLGVPPPPPSPTNPPPPPPPPTNPAVFAEFSTAAFRLGHSQLRSFIRLYEADGRRSGLSYSLSDSFFTSARLLNKNFLDNALRGLTRTPVQEVDQCFADDVTSKLFKPAGSTTGLDLVSLNLQRGRDHGLPTYSTVWSAAQQFLFGKTVTPATFEALRDTTSPETFNTLKSIYESIADVDLYIGGVTENSMPGALVGPTFAYIIYKQFENLRIADRFFYADLSKPGISLTQNQFNEIRKVSLSRIICDNNDGSILVMQGKAFRNPGPNNPVVPCSQIPGIIFSNLLL